MTASAVVFDIGGVLIDWQPHLAWAPELGTAGARDFIHRTGFLSLNMRADAGERFADLAREATDPEDAARIAAYVDLYPRTVPGVIPGTWEVLERLRATGTAVHAITNWSAETWPRGLTVHPRLGTAFDTLVVSGREGIMKPDRRIFELLCTRAGVAAADCVFIDDGAHNVAGAKEAGMDAIHFTDAEALADALRTRGFAV